MAMTDVTSRLVKTGYPNYGTETSFPLRLYVCYKILSQDTTNATTTLSLGMYFTVPSAWYVGPWTDDYGSYIGTTSNTFTAGVPENFSGTLWLVENRTMVVQHDAQGNATANIQWKWGVNSDYGQMEKPSGAFAVSLPNIPRASSATIGTAVAGSNAAITITRASTSFTHTLRYVFGSKSGTIATGVATSATWAVPYELLTEFPSATTGVGTLYCDTYSGSTLTGTTSKTFTVTAPDNETTKPAASMVLSAVSDLGVDAYVVGRSRVQADFTASSEYSTIASCAITVDGATSTGNPAVSGVLGTSGAVTVTGVVTDARGFSRTITENITVIPYNLPRVAPATGYNAVICERGLSSGETSGSGLYLVVRAARSYSPVTVDGTQTNFCRLQMRYKQSGAESWGTWMTLIAEDDLTTDEYIGILPDIVSSATTSYSVQLGVVDTIGGEWTQDFFIPTEYVAFHLKQGGKGAAFFGYSENDGELTVYGDLRVTGSATSIMERVYPVGAVYMSMSETDPAILFGFGTWERIMDKFLLAAGNTYAAGDTGGEDKHTLTVAEMPSHTHTLNITTDGALASTEYFKATANQGGTYYQPKTGATGNGAPHNNMPPYMAVYIWQRTA